MYLNQTDPEVQMSKRLVNMLGLSSLPVVLLYVSGRVVELS